MALFVFLIGCIIGSFINVLIYRLPRAQSLIPRSACIHCKKIIRFYNNIPIISFLLQQGKTRCCYKIIPLRYLLVELLTPVFFMLSYIGNATWIDYCFEIIFLSSLVLIFFIDLEHKLILHLITWPTAMMGIIYSTFYTHTLLFSLTGLVIGWMLVWGTNFLYKLFRKVDGMGMGDAFALACIGTWFGPIKVIIIFFLASLLGTLFILLYNPKMIRKNIRLPFGCFLSSAAILLFYDQQYANVISSIFL